MIIQPITLDMCRPDLIIIDPNIASMQTIPCININVSAADVCTWITSKGGWQTIAAYDIMTLVSAYLGQINLGFTVEMRYINGAIAYYLNMLDSGNNFTGCSFT